MSCNLLDRFNMYLNSITSSPVIQFDSVQIVLFELFEHYIPNFNNFPKKKKLEIILFGVNLDREEFFSTNVRLTIGVQNFILQTKRF